jgi:DNA-binding winged helix-turn-helix (wHTH) protein
MSEPKQNASRDLTGIRKEMDSLGEVDVEADMLWGAPTQRSLETRATVLRVGPLELDLIDRTATRGSRTITLRPREFLLLKYMMQRSDQVVSRDDLMKDVWHYKFVLKSNLVDVHMGRLRRKVDGSNEDPMIRNVRGEGFVLSASPTLAKALPELRSPGGWSQLPQILTTSNAQKLSFAPIVNSRSRAERS